LCQATVGNEGCSNGDEGEEVFGFAFVAAVQAAAPGKPGDGPLDNPTVPAEAL
jgi:hypothetical protein